MIHYFCLKLKKEQVAIFFKGLFALNLELECSDEGVALDWQLIYCYGRKRRVRDQQG